MNDMSTTAQKPDPFFEPQLSPDELIQRAIEIAPTLVERQEETEQRTFYAKDTHETFKRAGFYRMMVPRQFGGYEVDLATYHRVITAITSGCPSTGWQLCLGTIHTLIIGAVYSEAVQAEIYAGGNFICAATTAPQGQARRQADGSWAISGTFNYASGIPYSTHFMSHALLIDDDGSLSPSIMTFVTPRGSWEQLNDWGDSLGLRGSGSHSVLMENVAVPARFVREQTDVLNLSNGGAPRASDGEPGDRTRHGRLMSQFNLGPAAMMVGMLKGAVNEYGRLMRTKKTTALMPPVTWRHENDDYLRWFGTAAGKLAAAEAAIESLSRQWSMAAERAASGGEPFSAQEDQYIVAAALDVLQSSWDAISNTLWPTSGTSAAGQGQVMQRIYRDMSTARTHLTYVIADGLRRGLARQAFSVASGKA